MNIKDLCKGGYFIHCPTFEEWEELLKRIEDETNINWLSGDEPTRNKGFWNGHDVNTCLIIKNEKGRVCLMYGNINNGREGIKINIGSILTKKRSNIYEW